MRPHYNRWLLKRISVLPFKSSTAPLVKVTDPDELPKAVALPSFNVPVLIKVPPLYAFVPPKTTVPVSPPPIVKAPVEDAMLPFTVSTFPLAAFKVAVTPAVKVTSPVNVALLDVPVSLKVALPNVIPPTPLLIFEAALIDNVPVLTVVPPV